MSAFKTVGCFSARAWARLCVVIACLVSPAGASAQSLFFGDEFDTFATFGANATVMISGTIRAGTCDFIGSATNVYVVNVSSIGDKSKLVDVSNAQGLPNTIQSVLFGGAFFDEIIAFTAPAGILGTGRYGIVYDECQDGLFNAGVDTLFYPAFDVVIPVNIPLLPDASIQATKAAAGAAGNSWNQLMQTVNAIETMLEIKEALECISGGIAGCLASTAIGAMQDYIKEQIMAVFGFVDPKEAAKQFVLDTITHYGGIEADPPDPNYMVLDVLEPVTLIPQTSTDPLVNQIIAVGNAQATQAALLETLLHAIERYQGADIAGNVPGAVAWALEHARSIQRLAETLRAQLPDSNAALTALDQALTADPSDFDAGVLAQPLLDQIVTGGFQPSQVQALLNSGFASDQLDELRAHVAAFPSIAVTEAAMHASIANTIAQNAVVDAALASLATEMTGVINTLLAPPNFTGGLPTADAGGPYVGTEGVLLALSGAGSSDPGGSISTYQWDLDRDGQFDDANGVAPSFAFPFAFKGLVGLKVTDNNGNSTVDYAHVTIADANLPPVIDSIAPAERTITVPVGDTQTFTVGATDPEGAALSTRWLVNLVEVATGQQTHQHTFNAVGTQIVRVEVSDGSVAGGMVAEEWVVAVQAPDADADGWRANVDCNDLVASINPGMPEIIGNEIDDDCRPETLDGGTPPTASFTVAPGVKIVGQPVAFTDTSHDFDGPIAQWAWNFGDGQTSNQQHPSHVFAASGTFTVVLTITDGQGSTATTQQSVTTTHQPVAAFTYAPAPAVRNTPIQFTDLSADGDGPLASWSWVFGDGGVSN